MNGGTTTQTAAFDCDTRLVSAETNSQTDALQTFVALRHTPAQWLGEARDKLQNLATLGENWDSYGASPIDARSIECAQRLVENLAMIIGVRPPAVGATPDGEAGLSWDGGHWCLDADVSPDGRISYVFVDDQDPSRDLEASTRDPRELIALLTDWHQSKLLSPSEK